eukprot:Opistho-2@84127
MELKGTLASSLGQPGLNINAPIQAAPPPTQPAAAAAVVAAVATGQEDAASAVAGTQSNVAPIAGGGAAAVAQRAVNPQQRALGQVKRTRPVATTRINSVGAIAKTERANGSLNKERLQALIDEIKPKESVDEQLEEMLLEIGDDFIENVTTFACQLAKLRGSKRIEVRDIKLHLERNWDIKMVDIDPEEKEERPTKRVVPTDAYLEQLRLAKSQRHQPRSNN